MSNSEPNVAGPLVSVKGVSMRFPITKRFRELALQPFRPRRLFTALTDVTLDVFRGDRIAVLGPNGAGKTTLLKLIGGLLLPTEGEIVVNGVSTLDHNTAARKPVGFVMNEERSFFWRLSAMQNLEFFAALDNQPADTLRDRCLALIRFVGLEEHADKPVANYSSGMKQRLALARGLLGEPEVLILDEPTRTLDPMAYEEFAGLINERLHKDSGKTILIATHRLDEASRLCDKVLVVNKGRLAGFDRTQDLAGSGISLSDYYRNSIVGGGA
jgi:ABC-2 type transport system ATP-binding protein